MCQLWCMLGWALLMAAHGAVRADLLSWDTPLTDGQSRPEPRSYAGVAGLDGYIYVYGGYSHATRTWLDDLWSVSATSPTTWVPLTVQHSGPLEHATLVPLGDRLVLLGGRYPNGTQNTELLWMDPSAPPLSWHTAPEVNPTPELYWSSALPFPAPGGTPAVLLSGGISSSSNTVQASTYVLTYDAGAGTFSFTDGPDMPWAAFGHSLALSADGQYAVASGGLPAVPSQGVPLGLPGTLPSASAARLPLADPSQGWQQLGQVLVRGVAFHTSWFNGGALYTMGGVVRDVQNPMATTAPDGAPMLLAAYAVTAAGGGGISVQYDTARVAAAEQQWGAVRPGSLSGCGSWVDTSSSQPRVWLYGGWQTPQPLPSANAAFYLAPQDSTLMWTLDGAAGGPGAGQWLPPLTGDMAPRDDALAVPVVVGGQRMMLVVGGMSYRGAAAIGVPSRFLPDRASWKLPPGPAPEVRAGSYHLSDLWLVDLATGRRTPVWYTNGTATAATATCTQLPSGAYSPNRELASPANSTCATLPFGTSASPTPGYPLWDRRLIQVPATPVPGTSATTPDPGDPTNTAIYMHVAEVPTQESAPADHLITRPSAGIWRLAISSLQLPAAPLGWSVASTSAYVATWEELTPPPDTPGASSCYPRFWYGSAYVTSASTTATVTGGNATYVALYGGLQGLLGAVTLLGGDLSTPGRAMGFQAAQGAAGTCLLDVAAKRWLTAPGYNTVPTLQPRYRHACAPRPGLANYSMVCTGGVSVSTGQALDEAWVWSMQPGLNYAAGAAPTHISTWAFAPPNHTLPRPGPRVDHGMMAVRGAGNNGTVALFGGASSPDARAAARSDVWLMEPGCADPDAASSTTRSSQLTQLWLPLMPTNGVADGAGLGAAPSVVAASATLQRGGQDLWVVLLSNGTGRLGVRRLTNTNACLSTRASCSALSFPSADPTPSACWAGSPGGVAVRVNVSGWDTRSTAGNSTLLNLYSQAVDAAVVDAGGAAWPCQAAQSLDPSPAYVVAGIRLPPGANRSDYSIVMYGKPYVVLGRETLPEDPPGWAAGAALAGAGAPMPSVAMAFNATNITVQVRVNGSTAPPANVQLRVMYNGIPRKRRCVSGLGDCDAAQPGAAGAASFAVFPLRGEQAAAGDVAYMALVPTSYSYGTYSVLLPTPLANGTTVGGGAGATLQPGGGGGSGGAMSYVVDVPVSLAPAPPPDGRVGVTVNVTFLPSSQIFTDFDLPATRAWSLSFYATVPATQGIAPDPSATLSDTYSTAPRLAQLRLPPGPYFVQLTDSLTPSLPALEISQLQVTPNTTTIPLSVQLLTCTFKLRFSRVVVSPGLGFYVIAQGVTVSLHTVPEDPALLVGGTSSTSSSQASSLLAPSPAASGLGDTVIAGGADGDGGNVTEVVTVGGGSVQGAGEGLDVGLGQQQPQLRQLQQQQALASEVEEYGLAETLWGEVDTNNQGLATFNVIPGTKYMIYLSYPDTLLRTPLQIAPDVQAGSSTSILYEAELPQALLCAPNTITIINQQRGKFPSDDLRQVVYAPGTVCSWTISTGQPVVQLTINYTGLAEGDYLTVSTDTGFQARLPSLVDQGGYFSYKMTATNVTIRFRGNTDQRMGSGPVVVWEGIAQRSSMPPQFIMMIAASSAAAGAMLLFLCLWHCVFRPVQLRRQAAAAAMAAAANAAAAGAGGPGGPRGGGPRNRVPRRYLRMMETSTYSAKTAMAAKTAAGVAVAGGGDGLGSPGASDTPTTAAGDTGNALQAAADADGSIAPAAAGVSARKRSVSGGGAMRALTPTAVSGGGGAPDAATDRPSSGLRQPRASGAGGITPAPAADGTPAADGVAATNAADDDGGTDTCAICLCDFEDGEQVKHLPCKHFYHVQCIEQWLGRDITCPLCKDNVLEAMRTLFGPLPPRGTRQSGAGEGDPGGDGGGGLLPAAMQPDGDGGPLAVVVVPPGGVAAAVVGDNGAGMLPGSTELQRGAGDSRPGSLPAVGVGAGGPMSPGSGRLAAVPGAGVAAAAAGGVQMSPMSTRELRPMRRNISDELNSTSDDSDSDDFTPGHTPLAGGGAAQHPHGQQPHQAAGGWTVGASRPSTNQLVAAPSGGSGTNGGGDGGSPSRGPPQPASSHYFELSVLNRGSRPMGEQVQSSGHSASSHRNVNAGNGNGHGSASPSNHHRWLGGSAQVVPSPTPPPHGAHSPSGGGGARGRLPRTQESQLAAAAAALSAAAAATSGGGASPRVHGTPTRGAAELPSPPGSSREGSGELASGGGGGGGLSSGHSLSASEGGGHGPLPVRSTASAIMGAGPSQHKVYDNPLAGDGSGSGEAGSGSGASSGAAPRQPLSPAARPVLAVGRSGAPGAVAESRGGRSSGGSSNASSGSGVYGPGSVGSGGSALMRSGAAMAVPDVAGGVRDDVIRSPSGQRGRGPA